MNFGLGRETRLRSCVVAAGVSDIAAFRGRSLVGRLGFSVEVEGEGASVTAFGFWASFSEILMLCFSG